MTTSMVDPASDLAININGTFNLLEAARLGAKKVPVIFASTNKVYGDLVQFGTQQTPQGASRNAWQRPNRPSRCPCSPAR